MSGVTAYFVGGPKHGDIDRLPTAHPYYRIALAAPSTHYVNYGHYDAKGPATPMAYQQGKYRENGRLHTVGYDADGFRGDCRLYVWQGACR